MKSIYRQLTLFIKAQKPLYLLAIIIFCIAGTYINYGEGLKQFLKSAQGIHEYLLYLSLYAVFTIVPYLLFSLTHNDYSFWKKKGFTLLLLSGFAVFAFRSSFHEHSYFIEELSSVEQAYINRLVYSDLFRLIYLVIPVAVIWFVADRKTQPLYGFSARDHKWKVYFMLLACMVPLIVFASTQSDFLDYYPRVKKLVSLNAPVYKLFIYELCYGLDFVSIELFFRGFMIMAFARYVGINSVLPTACFYLSIHFGKPLGEAISSFFGGTILGLISYHTRSIYGGIMIHVGIAWLMELGATIGNWFRN